MKNKKGFTLIELLAVIAILAILVVLAVPAILKIFTSSKKDSFIVQAQEVYKAAEQQIINKQMQNPNSQITKFDSNEDENKIDLNGTKDINYCIKVYDNKIISIAISNGDFWYINNDITDFTDISSEDLEKFGIGEKKFSCDDNGSAAFSTMTLTKDQGTSGISRGDIVIVSSDTLSENFYVVSTNSTETVLLAKYNLLVGDYITYDSSTKTNTYIKTYSSSDQGYGLQNSAARGYDGTSDIRGIVPFSGRNYWDEYECYYDESTNDMVGNEYYINKDMSIYNQIKSKYAINGASYSGNPYPYVYDSNISGAPALNHDYQMGFETNTNYSIAYYVKRYFNRLGIKGKARLLSYEEAVEMKNYDINIIKNGVFWTGSAATNHHINGLNKNGDRSGVLFLWASDYGVRPAIVVSTSDIHTS